MQPSERAWGLVSIVELKSLARSLLPPSSPLRQVILSEPDYLRTDEVPIRVGIYSRLLHREVDYQIR